MRMRLLAASAVVVLLTVGAAEGAAPILDVRARLQIEITRAGRIGESFVIQGFVRDDAGAPLGGHLVHLRLVDPEHPSAPPFAVAARTLDSGRFELHRALGSLSEARWRLTADVEGDAHYAAPPPLERIVDLRRRAVTLSVAGPPSVSQATRAMRIEVALVDDATDDREDLPKPAPVSLFVGGTRLAEVTLYGTGRGEATTALTPAMLEGRETVDVEARYPGDSTRAPAEGRAAVRVMATTRLSLELTADELPRDGSVIATVVLTDERGPLAREPVALVEASVNGELDESAAPLAVAVTGPDGRARLELSGSRLGLGPHFVEARYQSSSRTRAASRSALVPLTVVAPRGRALLFYGVPLALVGGVLAARLLRARRARGPDERPRRPPRREHDAALSGGGTLVEARPTLLAALRAANDVGVAGRVEDARTGAPIVEARVVVLDGAGTRRELSTDESGRFAVEGLASGALALTIDGRGFVPEEIARELPHRGELRGLVVRLVPIKERVLAAWRALALPLLPNPAQAATLTPRELLALARRRFLLVGDDGALASLTALVEEACFGPRAPDLALLAEAERRCASARDELNPANR